MFLSHLCYAKILQSSVICHWYLKCVLYVYHTVTYVFAEVVIMLFCRYESKLNAEAIPKLYIFISAQITQNLPGPFE